MEVEVEVEAGGTQGCIRGLWSVNTNGAARSDGFAFPGGSDGKVGVSVEEETPPQEQTAGLTSTTYF